MPDGRKAVKSIVSPHTTLHNRSMEKNPRFMALLVGCVALTACGPLPVYYRQGTLLQRQENDTLTCAANALKQAPVANEIRQNPPIYYPGRRYCNAGNCWHTPGYWMDGGYTTVDVNRSLRTRIEQSCMTQKGYQRIELPRCNQSQIASSSLGSKQPALTQNSCAVRLENGSIGVLSPL